jgi:hypothetical protein
MPLTFGQIVGIFLAEVATVGLALLILHRKRMDAPTRQSFIAMVLILAPMSLIEILAQAAPTWLRGVCLFFVIMGIVLVVRSMRAARKAKSGV